MPLYYAAGPDGLRTFKIAGATPTAGELRRIERHLFPEGRPVAAPEPPEDPSLLDRFGEAFGREGTNLRSAAQGVAGLLGADETAASLETDLAARRAEEATQPSRSAKAWEEGDYAAWLGNLAVESAPQTAESLAGAGAGAALGTAVAPGPGTLAGALIGGALGTFPSFYGSNRERQVQEQGKVTSEGAAAGAAAGQAALDTIVNRFLPGVGTAMSKRALADIGKRAVAAGATETVTETAQQVLERLQADLDVSPMDEDARDEYVQAAIGAMALGGAFGGVSSAVDTGLDFRAKGRQAEIDRQIDEDIGRQAAELTVAEPERLALPAPETLPESPAAVAETIALPGSSTTYTEGESPAVVGEQAEPETVAIDPFEDNYRRALTAIRQSDMPPIVALRQALPEASRSDMDRVWQALNERGALTQADEYAAASLPRSEQFEADYSKALRILQEDQRVSLPRIAAAAKAGFEVARDIRNEMVKRGDIKHLGGNAYEVTKKPSVQATPEPVAAAVPPTDVKRDVDFIMDAGRRATVRQAFEKRLSGIGLKDVGVRLDRALQTATGAPEFGRYERDPQGERVIRLASSIYGDNVSTPELQRKLASVLDHEVVHALRDTEVVSPGDWKRLSRAAAGTKRPDRGYTYLDFARRKYAGQDPEIVAEEAVAEMFRDWAATRNAKTEASGVLSRLANAVRNIGKAVRGTEVSDIVDRFIPPDVTEPQTVAAEPEVSSQPDDGTFRRSALVGSGTAPTYSPNYSAAGAKTKNFLKNLPGIGRLGDRIDNSLDAITQRYLDKFNPVARIISDVARKGGVLRESTDAYLKETLRTGRTQAELEKRGRNLYAPLFESIKDLKPTDAEVAALRRIDPWAAEYMADETNAAKAFVEMYLYARHAPERNAEMARRNERVRPDMEAGSGMSNETAARLIDYFSRGKHAKHLAAAAKAFDEIIRDTNLTRATYGLTSEPIDLFQFYAPLRGFLENEADADETRRLSSGLGLKIAGREDQRALGRNRSAANLIEHAILQNETAVVRGEKNVVGNAFLNFLRQNPKTTADFATVVDKPPLTHQLVNDSVREVPDPFFKQQPNVLTIKENGVERYIDIKDERLRRALIGDPVSSDFMHQIMRMGSGLNRFLALTRTAFNPEFLVSNFIRDLQTALVNIGAENIPGIRASMMADVKTVLSPNGIGRGVAEVVRNPNKAPATEYGRWFKEMQEAGGTTAFYGLRDLDTTISRVNEAVSEGLSGAKAFQHLKSIRDFVEDYNTVAENITRLSAYKALRQRGWSKERAAQVSKNLTVNFNRSGLNGPALNALYLFYNASVQGSLTMLSAMSRSPKVRKMVGGIVLFGLFNDLLQGLMGGDDGDGKSIYDSIPDYILEHNMVFMDPFGLSGERGYFKLPMPYGYNVFYNAGRALGRAVRGSYSPGQALGSIAGSAVDAFNPFGSSGDFTSAGGFLTFLAPTVVDPIVELALNTDFAGNPIVPEQSPFGAPKPPSQRYWSSTSPNLKAISTWLAEATGGTPVVPGAIDLSPEHLQYAIDYVTGGLGRFVQRTADLGTRPFAEVTDGTLEVNDIPFLSKVVGKVGSRADATKYFEGRETALLWQKEFDAAAQDGDTARVRRALAQHGEAIRVAPVIKQIERDRSRLADLKREIMADPKIQNKQALVNRINEQIDLLVRQGNAVLSNVH